MNVRRQDVSRSVTVERVGRRWENGRRRVEETVRRAETALRPAR
jgi:hypothetical protein